ncbi:hypothetical protein HNQ94_000410 [Salirhabdus euzebyi]|uniref:Uncharacterized protein n=1 Tax=Salirhabdus euzebyi TaxID=394506 RepID=A0A841PT36_9BACI|nr:hypothetical protein [Salirhabdus euzebyi]MBB6451989.1 hypothetical protein [Salirhabdus euzebyi]
MKVKALRNFTDLKENKRRVENEVFEVTEERFKEINGADYGELVEDVSESTDGDNGENGENENFPKHTGGGWYELSNGEKIKGKDEAEAAEKALEK